MASIQNEKRSRLTTEHKRFKTKLIAGKPARIMRPRLFFIFLAVSLCMFGLLMVYSASSVSALSKYGTSTYYFVRQAIFMGIGWFIALTIYFLPVNIFSQHVESIAWFACTGLLILVLIVGHSAGGAVRWLSLGPINFQPSEFAKIVILMSASRLIAQFKDEEISKEVMIKALLFRVSIPLVLILAEPDTGSTIIIAVALLSIFWIAGLPLSYIIPIILFGVIVVSAFFILSPYRLDRLLVMLHPWDDPYGSGYQATLAIMAFASGGLFGRGIGNSTMKYNYLPEAHNDYILAIIGEECGFIGTVLFLLTFLVLCFTAFQIARQCSNKFHRYFVIGCSSLIMFQFFVNSMGIIGVIPMTGKTLPLISYGGSSVISSIMIIGLILRASKESDQYSDADNRRKSFSLVQGNVVEMPTARDASTAGVVTKRSDRRLDSSYEQAKTPSSRPRVIYRRNSSQVRDESNYMNPSSSSPFSSSYHNRDASRFQGRQRINLGGDAKDRLRPNDGPTVRHMNSSYKTHKKTHY